MALFIYAVDIMEGDAVGNHCLGIARSATLAGRSVRLFAQNFDHRDRAITSADFLEAQITADDLLLVSYSIFDPYLERLLKLPCKKICYFHGVTDPDLLREYEPDTADLCDRAISQFSLLQNFDLIIANSNYVAKALAPYVGKDSIAVLPPIAPAWALCNPCSEPTAAREKFNLLVVGRIVPHKRIEDALAILAAIRLRGVSAYMTIVGSIPNAVYMKFLLRRARELRVLAFVEFTGKIDDCDLMDCYSNASVLLSTSLHEGFCIPALESMAHGLLTVVRGGHAAEEVVGDAGIVIQAHESPDMVADRLLRLSINPAQREKVTAMARERVRLLLDRSSSEVWETYFRMFA